MKYLLKINLFAKLNLVDLERLFQAQEIFQSYNKINYNKINIFTYKIIYKEGAS
jgi:hypothetical protein